MPKKRPFSSGLKFSWLRLFEMALVGAFVGVLFFRGFATATDGCFVEMATPPSDYTQSTYLGVTLNQRTIVMLQVAEKLYSGEDGQHPFTLSQGSYSNSDSTSAGTHSGGGALDITANSQIDKTVKALRQAGFAAWHRTPAEGNYTWPEHYHAIAIGDREMSSQAADQITAYFSGKNGLANNNVDKHLSTIGRPIPDWAKTSGSRYCGSSYWVGSPPTAPSLSGTLASDTSANLTWSASHDDSSVTGYDIYRDAIKIGSATNLNFNDSSLRTSKTYRYRIWAKDNSGNIYPSNLITITTPDRTAPTPPTNLRNTSALLSKSVQIAWNAASDDIRVTGYYVYRDGVRIAQTSQLSYEDKDVQTNTTYTYKVKAYDAAANISADSNLLTVKTPCATQVGPVCAVP